MTLERITKSILNDAEREAERILYAARKAVQHKVSSARENLLRSLDERTKAVELELETKKAIELANLNAAHRQQLLKIKNNIIDGVFQRAMEQVASLPDDKYLAVIKKWLKAINSAGEISIGQRDSNRITQKFISKINQTREESAKLSLSSDLINIRGGFVLRTEKFEIDYSLDTIVSALREQLGPRIAQDLFGKQTT